MGFYEADTSWVDPLDGLGRQDSDAVYGVGILTSKGAGEIVYRNSSHGYYGGWIEGAAPERIGETTPVDADWVSPPKEVPNGAG